MTDPFRLDPCVGSATGNTPAPPAIESAENWWITHASLLSEKMKLGGVKDFRISLNDQGKYDFEVNPVETD